MEAIYSGGWIAFKVCFPVLNSIQAKWFFAHEKGVYSYVEEKDRFETQSGIQHVKRKSPAFYTDENGDIWYEELKENGNFEKGVLKFVNGKYHSV